MRETKSRRPRVRKRAEADLGSDAPVASTRHETLGVFAPIAKSAAVSKLKAAADRLAKELADVDEGEFVADFERMRRQGRGSKRTRRRL